MKVTVHSPVMLSVITYFESFPIQALLEVHGDNYGSPFLPVKEKIEMKTKHDEKNNVCVMAVRDSMVDVFLLCLWCRKESTATQDLLLVWFSLLAQKSVTHSCYPQCDATAITQISSLGVFPFAFTKA